MDSNGGDVVIGKFEKCRANLQQLSNEKLGSLLKKSVTCWEQFSPGTDQMGSDVEI